MKLEEQENEPHIQKLIQPTDHPTKVSIWADLTIDDIDKINESLNADHVKQILADVFRLTDYKEDLRSGILIDLYYYTLQFANDNNFSKEQSSAFFTIVKRTHEVCVETPFGNVQQTFNFFKNMLLCHAVNRPPHSIELFSANEVRIITEYVINSYFRNFKMYKYAFTPMVRLDLAFNYVGMPLTPEPSEVASDTQVGEEEERPKTATPEPEPEESEARKELRAMIENFLGKEIEKVKVSVDEQIKVSEATMGKKLEVAEEGMTGRKSRASPKSRKK